MRQEVGIIIWYEAIAKRHRREIMRTKIKLQWMEEYQRNQDRNHGKKDGQKDMKTCRVESKQEVQPKVGRMNIQRENREMGQK